MVGRQYSFSFRPRHDTNAEADGLPYVDGLGNQLRHNVARRPTGEPAGWRGDGAGAFGYVRYLRLRFEVRSQRMKTCRFGRVLALVLWALAGAARCGSSPTASTTALEPGRRVLLNAHNAYPYSGRWSDRLERALSTGLPIAIEQDLVWHRDPETGQARSIVSHGDPFTGEEPTLEDYFFERIRPLVEQALREDRRDRWPLIVLNLDFKTDEPEHHAALWATLGRYESWLTTATRTSTPPEIAALDPGPLLVLTGESDEQERSFHDRVPPGAKLRLFGAVHSRPAQAGTAAEARSEAGEPPDVLPAPKTNYRRWWNHSWAAVESGGQAKAGDWTPQDEGRLAQLVKRAHTAGLWIRFYTLNGYDPTDTSHGWIGNYNFGSRTAAEKRWRAAIHAGVDFVAVDQYEDFAGVLQRNHTEAAGEGASAGP